MHRPFIAIAALLLLMISSCRQGPENETITNATDELTPPKIDSSLIDFVMGKFDPNKDTDFVTIEEKYADRPGQMMQREAYDAFKDMYAAALDDGLRLVIRSATRNFDYQKGIWERKWTGQTILSDNTNAAQIADPKTRALKILQYSSMPGTSRHHWGTDIDLNAFENEWFESGEGLKIYNWLSANASQYGFCQPYTTKDSLRPNGYNEEKWHWSYSPLSEQYTQVAERYLQNHMIQGVAGEDITSDIDVKQNYILGINRCNH